MNSSYTTYLRVGGGRLYLRFSLFPRFLTRVYGFFISTYHGYVCILLNRVAFVPV